MTIEIRSTEPTELHAAASTLRLALLDAPPDDDAWAKAEPSWAAQHSFSAWEGDQCVGHISYFDVDTTLPGGGRVPTAAVTRAGVLPTHTRRGIFGRLMDEMIADAIGRGIELASLRASETTIYDRYGFGVAGRAMGAVVDTARALPLRGVADGSVELVSRDRILDVVRPLYDAASPRPGVISRPDWLWDRYFEEAVDSGKETVVAHRSVDGELDGYAHYEVSWKDDPLGIDVGTGLVHEVWATNPGAELALWSYLFGIDLVRSLAVDELATDSVLFAAAADERAVKPSVRFDEQWLRILDIDAVLSARAWPDAAPVRIGVVDPARPDQNGVHEIGSGGIATVEAPADITTDVAGICISAALLGSTSWWELVASGRASAASPTAVTAADAVFASRPLAYCGSFF